METKRYSGTVEAGTGYANVLGFRTVNIPLSDESIEGVYAARVTVSAEGGSASGGKEGEEPYMAAAFANQRRKILEAHILDFNDDLSGATITIDLIEKIRETKKFDTEPQLRAAIADDVEKVRAYFKPNLDPSP